LISPENAEFDVVILMPAYNDWESFVLLYQQIARLEVLKSYKVAILLINDGGPPELELSQRCGTFPRLYILHLIRNVGHQRAIALGLAFISEKVKCDAVIVMDSDGEDRPADIERLLAEHKNQPGFIVFASRTKRREGPWFNLFYQVYRLIFRVITGSKISFGNFCIIPGSLIAKLVHVPEIMSHLASAVIKSKLPTVSIPIERGKRLAGGSKMNYVSLIFHGFSAISVHLEMSSVRIIVASLGLGLLALLGIIAVVVIRYFTDLAILGWATSTCLGLGIIALQGLTVGLVLTFVILTYRMHEPLTPLTLYPAYIERFEEIT